MNKKEAIKPTATAAAAAIKLEAKPSTITGPTFLSVFHGHTAKMAAMCGLHKSEAKMGIKFIVVDDDVLVVELYNQEAQT